MDEAIDRQQTASLPELFSGVLSLDFANSVEPRGGPAPYTPPESHTRRQHDYVMSYHELVRWAAYAGAINQAQSDVLLAEAARRPQDAQAVFVRVITMREVIYRVFYVLAKGGQPDPIDLDRLTEEYHAAMLHARMVSHDDGFSWEWKAEVALDRVCWPIIQSAVTLLLEGDRSRIKVCPGVPGDLVPCAWLFYDASKNRVRNWCSMRDCGGTVKARRQNARRKRSG